jgi:hypothetical protein
LVVEKAPTKPGARTAEKICAKLLTQTTREKVMNRQSKKESTRISAVPGLAILGCLITGVAGIAVSLRFGDGIAVVGSAIAFGTIAVVSFRN